MTKAHQSTTLAPDIAVLVVSIVKCEARDRRLECSFKIEQIIDQGADTPPLKKGLVYIASWTREIKAMEDSELRDPGLSFDTTVRYQKATKPSRDWTVIRLAKRK